MRDQCAIGMEGHVKLFLNNFFREIGISIKSENVRILRKVRDFWYVMKTCEKMIENQDY